MPNKWRANDGANTSPQWIVSRLIPAGIKAFHGKPGDSSLRRYASSKHAGGPVGGRHRWSFRRQDKSTLQAGGKPDRPKAGRQAGTITTAGRQPAGGAVRQLMRLAYQVRPLPGRIDSTSGTCFDQIGRRHGKKRKPVAMRKPVPSFSFRQIALSIFCFL